MIGLYNEELQVRLLKENVELDKIVKQCQAVEQAKINKKLLQEDSKKVYVMTNGNKYHKKEFKEIN